MHALLANSPRLVLRNELAPPAVANGVVYIGSQAGTLYAINASTGSQIWSFAQPDPADPRLTGGEGAGQPTMRSPIGPSISMGK